MAKKKPPVNRPKQRAASTALELAAPRTEVYTLADIQKLRELRPAVRGGQVRRLPDEFGASGTFNVYGRIMNEDYNPIFDGKNALVVYDQMDRSDGQVGAAGEIMKLPLRSANWRIVPPEKPTEKEKLIAEACHEAIFGEVWPSGEGWDFTLRHLLMRIPFGFGCVEKVWMFDEDLGIFRFKRFGPRLPRTVDKFNVWPDGTLKEMVQYVADPGTGHFEYRTIPAEYLLISVREREGDNYFGKSVYRRLYKHWFYKDDAYRIDGIRLDRYGVGVPVAKIEEGHVLDLDELNEIELILQSLRSHERAYIIEPPKVTFRIMTPDGGHGGASGLMESVKHHDSMIVKGILATFLSDHTEGMNTNRTATLADIFLHALKAEARAVAGDLSSQVIRPFCAFNFDMSDARHPVVEVSGIGDLSPEQLATAISPLLDKAITADDTLEDVIRKIFGLPPLPPGWRRGEKKPTGPAAAPAGPGGPGTPPKKEEPGEPNDPDDELEDPERIEDSVISLAQTVDRYIKHAQQPVTVNVGGPKTKIIERDPLTKRIAKIVEMESSGDQIEMARAGGADYVRDDGGRFATSGGGGSGSGSGGSSEGAGAGSGDRPGEERFLAAPSDAVASLANHEKVSVARGDLRAVLDQAVDAKANDLDLTDLTVEDTALFAGGANRPRESMPQIPKEYRPEFVQSMKDDGIEVTEGTTISPTRLLPTQSEINAGRVGGMMRKYDRGDKTLTPIMVSKDNYVLDGHHRWATAAAVAFENPKLDLKQPITRIGQKRDAALKTMEKFMKKKGIKKESMTAEFSSLDESTWDED